MSKHGNIYADISSAQSMVSSIIEHAVKVAGSEKVLYGADAPLYCSSGRASITPR